MALQIYNTMTRAKEVFVPQEPDKVKMYVCGPTVYGYMHIGNARPVIVFDMVRNYLEALGNEVRYLTNFTDVDDKMIRKAEEMNITVAEVAEMFISAYQEDLTGLGVKPATMNPRVTESMDMIIEFIKELEEKGYAYENGGDVYYRTGKFADYGKLSRQNLEELHFGIRIEVDSRKENQEDFVLWKAAKPGEVHWHSPWGNGRPGWHIECSAMVREYLGETIDIHGGGQDLQFPHHECECAQTEALTGKPLSNYWMHNGFLNIGEEKMSKSLGNGLLVKDIRARFKAAAIRYFMLSSHYRNPLNFTEEALLSAEKSAERIALAESNVKHRLELAPEGADGEASAAVAERLAAIISSFHARMQDDFNTPDAITAVFDWVSLANQTLAKTDAASADFAALLKTFGEMNAVLRLTPEVEAEAATEEIERLIAERAEARKNKNWGRSDEIRDELNSLGILLEDTPQGMRWRRK
ncbi:cysteinyl-tRNA synthetase [Paenibacillus sp. FSL R7-0273]|uniref:cysteine--tRNA ligase n=1 Tax=Paenibacillus sp. FSL R7-0273 TaxID=1536772 RepID=UPI0004F5B9D1|nr:cysteine--tRNA ligase [Paenibacillus sp. FSL R7-0273]AIQ49593.1 cysteinyl-tRNA synthetase [Paenibacillus sp. FSL R7-0273]OMF85970.1 cysteine--tRNA ligase [Paenibacillus sp. FSL R7-0273]